MAPVVSAAVVMTILPLFLVTFMAYCITGYIRDILFQSTVKTCIGSSCWNMSVSQQWFLNSGGAAGTLKCGLHEKQRGSPCNNMLIHLSYFWSQKCPFLKVPLYNILLYSIGTRYRDCAMANSSTVVNFGTYSVFVVIFLRVSITWKAIINLYQNNTMILGYCYFESKNLSQNHPPILLRVPRVLVHTVIASG